MADLFRETIAGRLVRLATGSKFLKYPEERDPSLIEKYINPEKSGRLARTGTTQSKDPGKEKEEGLQSSHRPSSRSSSDTQVDSGEQDNALVNVPSGVKVDPEKGRDGHVVDWYGPDDLEVSLPQPNLGKADSSPESDELGQTQEVLGYVLHLFPDVFRLHRISYLHGWNRRCDASLRRKQSGCHARPHSLRSGICPRTHAFRASFGDTSDRT